MQVETYVFTMTTEVIEMSETTTSLYGEDITTTNDWESTTVQDILVVPTAESVTNYSSTQAQLSSRDELYAAAFDAFNILEIVMTSLELMLWIGAAIKMPRWRKNYRNQMLMQLSVARFIKRLIFTCMYLQKQGAITGWIHLTTFLNSSQIYIDFVIVIFVFFFIKHMYDSLIIVLVKCRQNSLYKVSICAWLLPAPISAVWTAVIVCKALNEQLVYLLICCIFRWPLILMGTAVYVTILFKVLSDKIRKFARSLTVVTFLMCLVINFYLVTKDVIKLWCVQSLNTTLLGYVSGFAMNFLILTFYIILISLDRKHCNQTPRNMGKSHSYAPDYSLTEINNFKI